MVDTIARPVEMVPRASSWAPAAWAGEAEITAQIAHDIQSNLHYDMPVEVFHYMIGPSMKYSSGLWDAMHTTLEAAQEANLIQVTDSLGLTPDSHVLDVGCGWGAFPIFAAQRTGCRVTGIGLAPRPLAHARAWAAQAGVAHLTDFRECHILALPDPPGTFSHVIFFETFEHMRLKRETLARVRRALRRDGTLYLQVIGVKSETYRAQTLVTAATQHIYETYGEVGDPVPVSTVLWALEENNLEVRAVQTISEHYRPTLSAWAANVRRHRAAIDALTEPGRADALRKYVLLGLLGFARGQGVNHQIWARVGPNT